MAVWLIVYFAIAFLIGPALQGIRGLAIVVVVTALLSGLAAGVLALIAIRRDRERSLLVYLALGPALFVLAFLIGELVFPH